MFVRSPAVDGHLDCFLLIDSYAHSLLFLIQRITLLLYRNTHVHVFVCVCGYMYVRVHICVSIVLALCLLQLTMHTRVFFKSLFITDVMSCSQLWAQPLGELSSVLIPGEGTQRPSHSLAVRTTPGRLVLWISYF